MLDLAKLALLLGFTIFLLMRKWDLGLVLLLDAALVALLFLYPPLSLVTSAFRGLVAPQTLNLAGAVFLVLLLAELLRRVQAMEKMVAALQVVIPDSRIVLALIPMVIGLMPMVGGAMFAAPMVNEIGTRLKLSAERKTFINYWFRHTMEFVFPLYSSLLMISALIGVSPNAVIRVSYPLSIAALAGGILWGMVGVRRQRAAGRSEPRAAGWKDLLNSTWPLLLVILAVVVIKVDMLLSLLGIIVLFVGVKRIPPSQWLDVLKRSFPLRTFSAIFGVMVFKQVVEDAGAVEAIPAAMAGLGLPPLLVVFLVPHLCGLLTGTAAAGLALSVPLVSPLLEGTALGLIPGGVWMFVGSFSGVLISPLHLCLALTQDYFGASWGRLYRSILPATALVVAAAAAILFLNTA